MATGGLYGTSTANSVVATSGAESTGLYGNGTQFGGSYFEWFIFQVSETQPATPTGGSWSFTTNSGTPPAGWLGTPPVNPTNTVWVSIALVNSKNPTSLTWSVPGKFSFSSGLPILSGSGTPLPGDGQSDQLYIQLNTTPQTIWFKESGTWTRLTGSSLYVDLTSTQTIGGTKTFSSPIAGSVTGTSANVTGIVAVVNGGTGATTAGTALTSLGAIGSISSADASIIVTQTGTAVDLAVSQTSPASVLVEQVRNNTGVTLTKGTAVYISGVIGQIPTVSKALATGDPTSAQTLGLITSDIANNSNGYVTITGLVANINTSAFIDGAQLYLSPITAGTLTATKPYAPQHLVYMAIVAYAHPTQGKLIVSVQNGYEMDELHNVSAQSPSNGQTLVYNTTTSLWEKSFAPVISGTTINSTTIGATTASTGAFTTLSASGAVTLSGGTVNGVSYLNASKVLTTGSALTFDGTNLGIGTSSPGFRLDVEIAARVRSNGESDLYLTADIDGSSGGPHAWQLQSNRSNYFRILQNSTERLRIDSIGNVGIGTSSPAYKLDVVGTANTFMSVGTTGASSGRAILYLDKKGTATKYNWLAGAQYNVDNAFEITPSTAVGGTTFSTPSLVVLQSGNVGIGTITPSASAILDAQSTTKGVRMPNMTTTQKNAIASPAAGLMVFDTTLAQLCVYTGAAWQTIISA